MLGSELTQGRYTVHHTASESIQSADPSQLDVVVGVLCAGLLILMLTKLDTHRKELSPFHLHEPLALVNISLQL